MPVTTWTQSHETFLEEVVVRLDAGTMRVIGQDIQRIHLFDFDLELEGKQCVVRGEVVPPEPEQSQDRTSPGGLRALWKQFWNPEPKAPPAPALVAIEKVYSQEDVARLEIEERSRRGTGQTRLDLYTTPEILRTVAAYCESKGASLVRLSKRGDRLKFDYLTQSGTRLGEEHSFSEMYDFAFRMYRKRGTGSIPRK